MLTHPPAQPLVSHCSIYRRGKSATVQARKDQGAEENPNWCSSTCGCLGDNTTDKCPAQKQNWHHFHRREPLHPSFLCRKELLVRIPKGNCYVSILTFSTATLFEILEFSNYFTLPAPLLFISSEILWELQFLPDSGLCIVHAINQHPFVWKRLESMLVLRRLAGDLCCT